MQDSALHHQEKHLQSSDLLTDIVIGMSDGLTVPFALAAGLSGAVSNTSLITIAGIAEIAAGSIAMGVGGYLAGKTEQDHYNSELAREYEEIETKTAVEEEEIRTIFKEWGFSRQLQDQAVAEISKDKDRWVSFMTLVCLFIFGYFKSKLTGVNPLTGGMKVLLIGASAAAAAIFIAKFIDGMH